MPNDQPGPDTPPATPAVVPTVDTPPPAAPAAPVNDHLSDEDREILGDIRGTTIDEVTPPVGDDETPPVATTDEDEWPDPEKDPQGYRNEWLKRNNALAEREKAITDREAALTATPATPPAAPPADPNAPATPSAHPDQPTETPSDAPESLEAAWQVLKTEIEDAQENFDNGDGVPKGYESPGEQRLMAFNDLLVKELSEVKQFITGQQNREVENLGHQIVQTAQSAIETLKAEFDVEVDGKDLIGIVQNGGAQAYATLHGIRLDQVQITNPKVMAEIYAMKNAGTLKGKSVSPTPEPKKALPDHNRGGGPRQRTEPLTEHEEIMEDINAARAAGAGR